MRIGRRALFSTCLTAATAAIAHAEPKSNSEWEARLGKFALQWNIFVRALEKDGIIDLKQWKRVEQAWAELEGEK